MSYRGPMGHMGYSSNEHPITMKLIDTWNDLGMIDGYIYSEDNIPMPDHLKKLNDAIESVRNKLSVTPYKINNK